MALRLNLYHEVQKQKRAKSRDPLKLSVFGLAGIAVLFAGYYAWQIGRMSSLTRELTRKKAEFDSVEPQAKFAKKRQDEITAMIKKSELFVKRIEHRFYWAPLLAELARVVPNQVQITKLSGDLQGEDVKKCTLTIDGVSAGADPRRVAEDLRTAIAEEFSKHYQTVTSTFRSLEDGTESVTFNEKKWPTATFAINVQLSAAKDITETRRPIAKLP